MIDVLGSDEDSLEAALGLGELAGLTIANDADTYDVSNSLYMSRFISCYLLLTYLGLTLVPGMSVNAVSYCAVINYNNSKSNGWLVVCV